MVYCQNLLDKLGLDADEIINMKMAQNEAKYPVEKQREVQRSIISCNGLCERENVPVTSLEGYKKLYSNSVPAPPKTCMTTDWKLLLQESCQ